MSYLNMSLADGKKKKICFMQEIKCDARMHALSHTHRLIGEYYCSFFSIFFMQNFAHIRSFGIIIIRISKVSG